MKIMPYENSRPVLHAEGVTKRYGRRTALRDCTLTVPRGRMIGLVGPNGAGKSTLLQLACGLITPSAGSLEVLGAVPGAGAGHLAKVGFVAQDTPVYAGFSVGDHLKMGAKLNPGWDQGLAERRIAQVGLDRRQKAGRLSGGQRAQLALTLAAAKRPELLMFDEPAAALDPLARDGFLRNLVEFVTELDASAILSSHLLGDVARVCDYLIVLCASRVRVAGDVSELLATHDRVVAPRGDLDHPPAGIEVIRAQHADGRTTAVVRGLGTRPAGWSIEPIQLEELVLAYLAASGEEVR
jgi:ABC-2 type transport system ATP-binding protein